VNFPSPFCPIRSHIAWHYQNCNFWCFNFILIFVFKPKFQFHTKVWVLTTLYKIRTLNLPPSKRHFNALFYHQTYYYVTGKVVCVLNQSRTTPWKRMGERMYRFTFFLTSALTGGKWLSSRSGRFTPRERNFGNHWIRGWVDPRSGLDDTEKCKFFTPPGIELQTLGRPARSQSLYRLYYFTTVYFINIYYLHAYIYMFTLNFMKINKY
jgi:hypothetical protein